LKERTIRFAAGRIDAATRTSAGSRNKDALQEGNDETTDLVYNIQQYLIPSNLDSQQAVPTIQNTKWTAVNAIQHAVA
jgi:hypothetical protein